MKKNIEAQLQKQLAEVELSIQRIEADGTPLHEPLLSLWVGRKQTRTNLRQALGLEEASGSTEIVYTALDTHDDNTQV